MKKIIEYEIVGSLNEKENGIRYFFNIEGRISDFRIEYARVFTGDEELEHALKWVEDFNLKHSNYCKLENVRVINLEELTSR